MSRLLWSLLCVSLWFGATSEVFAQFNDPEIPEQVVKLETHLEPADPRPGEHVRVVAELEIHPGWHVYSVIPAEGDFAPIATAMKVQAGPLEVRGPVYESNPILGQDPVLEMELAWHEEHARILQNAQAPQEATPQSVEVSGTLRFQACSDQVCLPPESLPFVLSATLTSGAVREAFSVPNYAVDEVPTAATLPAGDELQEALSGGLWSFLGLAVVAGLLALLTPCVFPMIPITVAFFTKQGEKEGTSTLRLALLFGAGIVGTYTVTGMGLSAALGASGAVQLATNGWVNLVIGAMFTVFALSLMGFLNLALPAGLSGQADQWSRQYGGVVGVLLMGFVFTLTSFTCTVQFVGTMLIAASQGHWLWPLIGMVVFATVFAFPFFLLGLFPRLIQTLRGKSGDWMEHLKVVLGLLELAAAFKFFSNTDLVWQWGVINRDFVITAWVVLAGLGALFLLGAVAVHHVRVQQNSLMGFVGAFAFLMLGVYLLRGLGGVPLNPWVDTYLPPELSSGASMPSAVSQASGASATLDVASVEALPWQTDLQAALSQARTEGKHVFVDFTGYTCVNCRWMEKNVFAQPEVLERFRKEFILVQLYTDGGPDAEANQQLQIERFNTVALPLYVVLDEQDQVLARHAGILKPAAAFLKFLGGSS
jgi:thiol:disulfide interchange protein